jgi:hypothetical protein
MIKLKLAVLVSRMLSSCNFIGSSFAVTITYHGIKIFQNVIFIPISLNLSRMGSVEVILSGSGSYQLCTCQSS